MVFINDVWSELWHRSRNMIISRNFRNKSYNPKYVEKTHRKSQLEVETLLTTSPQVATIETSQQRIRYQKNVQRKPSSFGRRSLPPGSQRKSSLKRTSSRRRTTSCFNPEADIYVTIDPSATPGGLKLVKCHIYDTVTLKKPILKTLNSVEDPDSDPDPDPDTDREESSPGLHISEEAVIHHAPFTATSSTDSILDDISRLIKDENGEYLSPIKHCPRRNVDYSELMTPSPPRRNPPHQETKPEQIYTEIKDADQLEPEGIYSEIDEHEPEAIYTEIKDPEPIPRRNMEDRFVVNAYRSGCWQRLSKRGKLANIDDTRLIKITERKVANIDSGDYVDMSRKVKENKCEPNINNEHIYARIKLNNCNRVNTKAIVDNVNLVGEMYRARITPDKKKLQQRQRRVVPNSLLSMFDDMPAQEVLQAITMQATKLEEENSQPLYATPIKTPRKPVDNSAGDEKKEKPISSSVSIDNETFIKLKEEADYQCKIMRQASKALEVSRRSVSFSDIRPEVEAEKILLTANCKYEKVLQEIRQPHQEKPAHPKYTGTIEISSLTFEISPDMTAAQVGYFVLVMTDDKKIFTSSPVDVHVGDKTLAIDRTFRFERVDASFEIVGKLYCLLNERCSRKKSDGRLSNKLRMSARKLRYTDLYTKDPVETSIVSSSFIPIAQVKVNVNDLHRATLASKNGEEVKNLKMILYENCPLTGSFQMEIKLAQLEMGIEKVGMVNVRCENNPMVWNRRWCTLAGSALRFWNSPLDETFNPPFLKIDLTYCLHEIENAKREDCPRPKTLMISTVQGTYYINIDTINELREWKEPLNEVYRALKDWKLLKVD